VDTNTVTQTRTDDTRPEPRNWFRRLLHRIDQWTLYAFNPVFPHHRRR
jgi:hypothetical protein